MNTADNRPCVGASLQPGDPRVKIGTAELEMIEGCERLSGSTLFLSRFVIRPWCREYGQASPEHKIEHWAADGDR
jgi:hypothetical protein